MFTRLMALCLAGVVCPVAATAQVKSPDSSVIDRHERSVSPYPKVSSPSPYPGAPSPSPYPSTPSPSPYPGTLLKPSPFPGT